MHQVKRCRGAGGFVVEQGESLPDRVAVLGSLIGSRNSIACAEKRLGTGSPALKLEPVEGDLAV